MIGIDTNVLMRYLAQDDALQSPQATRLIEEICDPATPGFIGLVVLVEVVWVAESCYRATRAEIAEILRRILSIRQFVVQDSETVWKALRSYVAGNADFSDCLIERLASANGCSVTMTFDRAAATVGMRLL